VGARVAVAGLGRLGEAADDLELRLAQLLGALAHAALEDLVIDRDAPALAQLGQVARGDRARRAHQQGGERPDDRDDPAGVERELRDRQPADADERRDERDRERPGAQAARAGASASAITARRSNQPGALRSGRSRSAVQIALAWISGRT
jgi:hypothetical protein